MKYIKSLLDTEVIQNWSRCSSILVEHGLASNNKITGIIETFHQAQQRICPPGDKLIFRISDVYLTELNKQVKMYSKECNRIDERRGHIKLDKSKTISTHMEKKAFAVLPACKSDDGLLSASDFARNQQFRHLFLANNIYIYDLDLLYLRAARETPCVLAYLTMEFLYFISCVILCIAGIVSLRFVWFERYNNNGFILFLLFLFS